MGIISLYTVFIMWQLWMIDIVENGDKLTNSQTVRQANKEAAHHLKLYTLTSVFVLTSKGS